MQNVMQLLLIVITPKQLIMSKS